MLAHPLTPGGRVKSYEGKLATLTAINSALQSENGDLRRRLEEAAAPSTATGACRAGAPRGCWVPPACAAGTRQSCCRHP